MNANLRKIFIKLKQKANNNPNKISNIQRGSLKGIKWLLNISDPNYLLGNYEKGQTALILDQMKTKSTFIDVGANSGYFSLGVKKHYPEKEVFLFEPLPKNIKIIKTHFSINFPNTSYNLIEKAIGDQQGNIQFTDSGNDSANTYKHESSLMNSSNKIDVTIDTLDHLAEEFKWSEDVFIKVDIEGAELDFLKGGAKYLSKFHPPIILATHDCHVPGVEKDCLDFSKKIGYQCKLIKDDKITGQVDYLLFK
jgi:FkbM family methyltransferase